MECFQRHLSKNNIPDFRGGEMRQKIKLALSAREKKSHEGEATEESGLVEGLRSRG